MHVRYEENRSGGDDDDKRIIHRFLKYLSLSLSFSLPYRIAVVALDLRKLLRKQLYVIFMSRKMDLNR